MDQKTSILIRPIITEKSMSQAGSGRFTFAVAKEASKGEIRQVIEKQFNVNVVAIQTIIVKGKTRRAGKRRIEQGVGPYKKAIVLLKKDQKIDLFDVQSETGAKK